MPARWSCRRWSRTRAWSRAWAWSRTRPRRSISARLVFACPPNFGVAMNATAAQTFEVSAAGIADVSQQGKNRRHGFAGPRGRHAATNQPAREPAADESAEIRGDESAEIRGDERNPRRHPDLRHIETVDALEVLRKPEEVKIYKKRWLLDSERFGALHPPIAHPAMIAQKNGKQRLDSRPQSPFPPPPFPAPSPQPQPNPPPSQNRVIYG